MSTLEPVFIDASAWLHVLRDVSPLHQAAREWLLAFALEGTSVCISPQVVRELYLALLKSDLAGAVVSPEGAVAAILKAVRRCTMLSENSQTARECLELTKRLDLPARLIHCANVAATMRAHHVTRLLTGVPADYAPFAQLIKVHAVTDQQPVPAAAEEHPPGPGGH